MAYKIVRITRGKKKTPFLKKMKIFLISTGVGGVLLFLIMTASIFGYVMNAVVMSVAGGSSGGAGGVPASGTAYNLSEYTLYFKDLLFEIAAEQEMSEYREVLLAIMEVESGGVDLSFYDRMCSSECPFNTDYPQVPEGINQEPDANKAYAYSITAGVKWLKYLVTNYGANALQDENELKAIVQCYNYGEYFYTWLKNNYGGQYSYEAAEAYSQWMRNGYGYSVYGNPHYIDRFLEHFHWQAPVVGSGGFSGGTVFHWPLDEDVYYAITSDIGPRVLGNRNDNHSGIDIGIPEGTPVYAAQAGIVDFVWNYTTNGYGVTSGNDTYGICCRIDHSDIAPGYNTLYAHLSKRVVENGDYVAAGQLIGYSGNTGNSTGPHLHFEFNVNGIHKSALDYIRDPLGYYHPSN